MQMSMQRLRSISKCMLVLILTAPFCSGQEMPDWIMNRPDVSGEISIVADGEFKLDALVKALGELAMLNDLKVKAFTTEFSDVSESNATLKIGGIEIKATYKKLVEISDQGVETLSYALDWCQITLQKDTSGYIIKYFNETTVEEKKKHRSHSLEALGENVSFNDLMRELKDSGIRMKTYEAEEAYYILVIYQRS